MLTAEERERLFRELETMPSYLLDSFGGVAAEAQTRRGPGDTFSPVEQCWHLADLEAEGYAVRIRRLLTEEMPSLSDFDGDRVAQERQYRARSFHEGLQAFQAARRTNLAALRAVSDSQWARRGVQEGVGEIRLADVPRMMSDHDAAHRAEIAAWLQSSPEPDHAAGARR